MPRSGVKSLQLGVTVDDVSDALPVEQLLILRNLLSSVVVEFLQLTELFGVDLFSRYLYLKKIE
jgi:hypothetical protein